MSTTGKGPEVDEQRLQDLLNRSAALHDHLCPRQVLGVRIGMYAGDLIGMTLPQRDKRLLTIVETDGCFADGVSVSTGCWLGRRTLRCVDYGKVAAVFIDTHTGEAVRIHPSASSRQLVTQYAPDAADRWHTYLEGYQVMPAEELLVAERVRLVRSIEEILSRPGLRAICDICQEEIANEREIVEDGRVLCRSCAGHGYYRSLVIAESLRHGT